MATLEHLALERRTPPAGIEAMAQLVAIDSEVAGIGRLLLQYLGVRGGHRRNVAGLPHSAGLPGKVGFLARMSRISSSKTSSRGGAGASSSIPASRRRRLTCLTNRKTAKATITKF